METSKAHLDMVTEVFYSESNLTITTMDTDVEMNTEIDRERDRINHAKISHIPRFDASDVAAIAGLNFYVTPLKLINKYLYQDRYLLELQRMDASNLGLVLVSEEMIANRAIQSLPDDNTKEKLLAIHNDNFNSLLNSSAITVNNRVTETKAILKQQLERSVLDKSISPQDVEVLEKYMVSNIQTQYGILTENKTIDKYESTTGYKVTHRNELKRYLAVYNAPTICYDIHSCGYLQHETENEYGLLKKKIQNKVSSILLCEIIRYIHYYDSYSVRINRQVSITSEKMIKSLQKSYCPGCQSKNNQLVGEHHRQVQNTLGINRNNICNSSKIIQNIILHLSNTIATIEDSYFEVHPLVSFSSSSSEEENNSNSSDNNNNDDVIPETDPSVQHCLEVADCVFRMIEKVIESNHITSIPTIFNHHSEDESTENNNTNDNKDDPSKQVSSPSSSTHLHHRNKSYIKRRLVVFSETIHNIDSRDKDIIKLLIRYYKRCKWYSEHSLCSISYHNKIPHHHSDFIDQSTENNSIFQIESTYLRTNDSRNISLSPSMTSISSLVFNKNVLLKSLGFKVPTSSHTTLNHMHSTENNIDNNSSSNSNSSSNNNNKVTEETEYPIDFYISGRFDGISYQPIPQTNPNVINKKERKIVIECKNRVRCIHNEAPFYDQIQLVTYMIMNECFYGDLIEAVSISPSDIPQELENDKVVEDFTYHRIKRYGPPYYHDDNWHQIIVPRMQSFAKFIRLLRSDNTLRYQWLLSDDMNKYSILKDYSDCKHFDYNKYIQEIDRNQEIQRQQQQDNNGREVIDLSTSSDDQKENGDVDDNSSQLSTSSSIRSTSSLKRKRRVR